ncbi:MAG: YggS family pyridoxal phosphate-dependent enzyme, partial [Schwartzia sp.]|nr:YggS family pyridoxal phosphate-dependent enzyme [Schwartzia sp. (in: firmicutes)]
DVEECRPLFREMREIFDRLRDFPLFSSEMKYLSMGMTHDYKIAVEEGANLVRVGTAIFGARQY